MRSAHSEKHTAACTRLRAGRQSQFQKHTYTHTKTHRPVCVLCCALSTDGASVKDTNESNETEGKTAPEIYTTVKHLRETVREQREPV